MPFPKILAPIMPRKRSKGKESKATNAEFILSPAALPLSPQQEPVTSMNENGDPIIELATTYEEASNCSQESLNELCAPEEVTENAIVLHEKPTAFDLCDNDLIIESVKDVEEEQEKMDAFDQDMMRNFNDLSNNTEAEVETAPVVEEVVVKANTPEIDFAPPVEFMNKEDDANPFDAPLNADIVDPAMVALPPPPPVAAMEETQIDFTAPIQAELEPVQTQMLQSEIVQPTTEFIQTALVEETPNVFATAINEPEANFAMETTFHKTHNVKSKLRRMFSSARVLVCKPDRVEKEEHNRIKALFDSKVEINSSTAGQESSNYDQKKVEVPFISAYDKQAEEDAKTPIYRRRNTSHTSLFELESDAPVEPYKSPLIGSDAYDIKLLCDQSFFGRW